jgi:hypothetical protein
MATVRVGDIAFVRSGDKGSASNVGIVARSQAAYTILEKYLTPVVVHDHFRFVNKGIVDRYELPNIRALNFILHDSLGGGGSESLRTDAQGKTHGMAILELQIEITEDEQQRLQSERSNR